MQKFFLKKIKWLLFLSLFLGACKGVVIYHDLTENDANEMLVALHDRGIEALKVREEKNQEVTWTVQVSKKDAAYARKILLENDLPHPKQLGFSGICKEKGLIPTPEEEKCRKILALKGEIINSLEKIPGVVDADVVLNIPEISEFASETQASKRPTASAVIRAKKSSLEPQEITEPKIQRFISNTVENLDPRDVSVVITFVQPPENPLKNPTSLSSIAGLKMDVISKKRFQTYAVVGLVLLLAVSIGLVLTVLKLVQIRRLSDQNSRWASRGISGSEEPPLISAPPAENLGKGQIPADGETASKS